MKNKKRRKISQAPPELLMQKVRTRDCFEMEVTNEI